jgi:hypothetical protein
VTKIVGSGSTPKCHGSATLLPGPRFLCGGGGRGGLSELGTHSTDDPGDSTEVCGKGGGAVLEQ